jgi:GNAT superfamily N-acetyltransferase
MSLEFRTACHDDAATLSLLAIHVYVQTYATAGLRPLLVRDAWDAHSLAAWQAAIARDACEVIVAELDGHAVGFAQLSHRATHPLIAVTDSAELDRLYVQERFTGHGVGRSLLAQSEQRAAAGGAHALWLTAWVGNPRALRFYAARGYDDVGSWPYRFEDEAFDNRVFLKRL